MKTKLAWKKGLFKTAYEIYSKERKVGYLKDRSWSQSSNGELNGEYYSFKTSGFINQKTQIFYSESDTPIAKISYNSWMTKARIEYSGTVYYWSLDNFWSTKWSLRTPEGPIIGYNGSLSNGIIESDIQNNFLILTGLFIKNYYLQMSVVLLLVVFLPLITTFFS
jgi:hypothetical protein